MRRITTATLFALTFALPACAEMVSDQESHSEEGQRPDESSQSKIGEDVMDEPNNALKSAEIEILLRGKRFSNVGIPKPGFMGFGERFYANGDWFASYQTRGPTQIQGRWRISDDRICITPTGREEHCRSITRSDRAETYLIKPYWPSREVDFVEVQIHEI